MSENTRPAPTGRKAKPTEEEAERAAAQAAIQAHNERVRALATALCEADGQRPDGHLMGHPRWYHFIPAAEQHIAAHEFFKAETAGD